MNQSTASQKTLKGLELCKLDRAHFRKEVLELLGPSGLRIKEICDLFGIGRATFWRWQHNYKTKGIDGLVPQNRNGRLRKITPEVEQKILELRSQLGYGHQRIAIYLRRYMGIKVAPSSIWAILKRNKMPNLYMTRYNKPAMCSMKRYEKAFPGETIQMDVKFINVKLQRILTL